MVLTHTCRIVASGFCLFEDLSYRVFVEDLSFLGMSWPAAGSFFDTLARRMIPVLVKGGIGSFFYHPIGRKNTPFIPGIYCLRGGYIIPTTL